MLQRKRGHIVNISSLGGHMGFPHTEVYSACKDGLIGFTRVLRADYRDAGVSSSVLILGSIGGGGTTVRTLEETGFLMAAMGKAFMFPAEAVGRAGVQRIKSDQTQTVSIPRTR